jgi:hypothetical protein
VSTRNISHIDAMRRALWAHVLVDLFAKDNPVTRRPNSTLTCGHEPWHSSRSGRCVIIWPSTGRWWCSSCRKGGDAVTYVMARQGCDYASAAQWLGERYGFPKNWRSGWRERASWPRVYTAFSASSVPTYVCLEGRTL